MRSADEIIHLIERGTQREGLAMWGKIKPFWKPLVARISGYRFRLRQHRNYGNSFGPLFYGEVQPTHAGSEIRGRFTVHPAAQGFMLVWLAGVAAFGVFGALEGPTPESSIPGWLFPLTAVGFGGFAVLLMRFSWWLGTNERRTIYTFLEDLARGEPSPGQAPVRRT